MDVCKKIDRKKQLDSHKPRFKQILDVTTQVDMIIAHKYYADDSIIINFSFAMVGRHDIKKRMDLYLLAFVERNGIVARLRNIVMQWRWGSVSLYCHDMSVKYYYVCYLKKILVYATLRNCMNNITKKNNVLTADMLLELRRML